MTELACRLAGDDFDPVRPHIIVQCKHQRCLSCGAIHRWSETFEVTVKGTSRIYTPTRTARTIPVDYQVVAVEIAADPCLACHECIGTRPKADADVQRRWSETLARKKTEMAQSASEPGTFASGASRKAPPPSIDIF